MDGVFFSWVEAHFTTMLVEDSHTGILMYSTLYLFDLFTSKVFLELGLCLVQTLLTDTPPLSGSQAWGVVWASRWRTVRSARLRPSGLNLLTLLVKGTLVACILV